MKIELENVMKEINICELAHFLDITIAGIQYVRREGSSKDGYKMLTHLETDLQRVWEQLRAAINEERSKA
jgi:hypothetical protein